jgi:hypothetical protein
VLRRPPEGRKSLLSDLKYYVILSVAVIATVIKIWPTLKYLWRPTPREETLDEGDLTAEPASREAEGEESDTQDEESPTSREAEGEESDTQYEESPTSAMVIYLDEGRGRLKRTQSHDSIKRARSRARDILKFHQSPLKIVLGAILAEKHWTVSLPDLTAARVVAAAVPDDVSVYDEIIVDKLTKRADRRNNLLLIGSSERNVLTGEVLSHESTRALIDCDFTEGGERSERTLHYEGTEYGLKELESFKLNEENSADFALLAKIPNPFNPDATVVIIAGRHALGTRGTAEFLADWTEWETDEFKQRVGGGYFAVVIYVEAEGIEDKLILTDVQTVEGSLKLIDFPNGRVVDLRA